MKLTFRKREVKNLSELQSLVTDNADAIEPGLRVVATSVSLGRSSVDLAGLDVSRRPVLIALDLTADDAMIFKMVEAYAWCLEYPESVQRLVPRDAGPCDWPPRVAFVAERLLESFLRKIRLLKFPQMDCFEYRYVEVNGSTGFYLDPVDWTRGAPARPVSPPPDAPPPPAPPGPEPEPHEERRVPSATPTNGHRTAVTRPRSPDWSELLGGRAEAAERVRDAAQVTDAPAPENAAPDDRVEAPGADAAQPGLDELDLGATRELTPTWRKFLDKLTGGFDSRPAPALEDVEPVEPVADAAPAPIAEAEPPAPAEPEIALPPRPMSPAPRGGAEARRSADALLDPQRLLLEGLKLPSNGELAPQWRKFLERPTALDDAKTGVVREYLQREFPMSTVYDFHDFQRNAQVFQLQDNHGKVMQLATLTAEFFDEHRESELRAWVEQHRLAQALRQAGQAGVLVTKAGLQVDHR